MHYRIDVLCEDVMYELYRRLYYPRFVRPTRQLLIGCLWRPHPWSPRDQSAFLSPRFRNCRFDKQSFAAMLSRKRRAQFLVCDMKRDPTNLQKICYTILLVSGIFWNHVKRAHAVIYRNFGSLFKRKFYVAFILKAISLPRCQRFLFASGLADDAVRSFKFIEEDVRCISYFDTYLLNSRNKGRNEIILHR